MSYLQEKTFQFWGFFALACIGFVWLFHPILAPFVVGIAVAYLLNPIVAKLEAKHIPRWLSALVILFIFFSIVILALLLAVPILVREMIEFIQLLPSAFAYVQEVISEQFPTVNIPQTWDDVKALDPSALTDRFGSAMAIGQDIIGNIFKSGMAIIGVISFMALMPIVAFYLMIDWSRFTGKIFSLLPQKNAGKIKNILSDIDCSLAGFIRGQLMVCTLLGLFYAIALSLMGLQYGFFIGIAAGVLSIIPYVGSLFGLVASVGMAFYQFGGWQFPLIAFVIFIVGQLVEGNYLTPKLVGDSVGLHPIWVIFALMAGGMLLGLLGMIIAIPVAAVLSVLLRYAVAEYKETSYYKGKK
jgi:predicted PurR-regulated permease PerM